jgi:hypothetical protein
LKPDTRILPEILILGKKDFVMEDKKILNHIEELVAEEQRLYAKNAVNDAERKKLKEIEVELDQYWDLLRQRRALRDAGKDPDQAELRGPDTVENYEQ